MNQIYKKKCLLKILLKAGIVDLLGNKINLKKCLINLI